MQVTVFPNQTYTCYCQAVVATGLPQLVQVDVPVMLCVPQWPQLSWLVISLGMEAAILPTVNLFRSLAIDSWSVWETS